MPTLPTEPLQITEPGAPSERRRGRNDLRRNLVGLSRNDLKATLTEAGLAQFARCRAAINPTKPAI